LVLLCGSCFLCVANYFFYLGWARWRRVAIETGRGVLTLELEISGGRVDKVRVDMGPPILEAEQIPTLLPGNPPVAVRVELADRVLAVTAVSMGNPHAVVYLPDVDNFPLESVGPILERHSAFPRRVNVHVVQILAKDEVRMRTWERGSGITLACGTGACAVCVAGVLTGQTARSILAHLPGGDLELAWPVDRSSVFMTGPAIEVFSGEWPD
jgi:diaminopimelate epimerase